MPGLPFMTICFTPLFVIFAVYTWKDWNIYNVLPVLDAGPLKLLDGALVVLWALAGIEILLVLPRYVQQIGAKKVLRIALLSNGTTVLFYTFCVFSSMVLFGSDMISYIREPLLYQMKAISFNIIERMDLILISIWILFVVSSFCSYFLLFVSSISAIFKKKEEAPLWLTIICGGLFFLASIWQFSAEQLDYFHELIHYWVAAVSLALIAGILLILKLTGTKGPENHDQIHCDIVSVGGLSLPCRLLGPTRAEEHSDGSYSWRRSA